MPKDHGEEYETTERYPPGSIRAPEPAPDELTATLTVLKGPELGAVFQLGRGSNIIGRAPDAEVRIAVDGVSRTHAKITEQHGRYWIEDLGSTNGTQLRGANIAGSTELRDGDRISLGGTVVLRFAREGELEQRLREELYSLATRDPMTRAYNRSFFEERLGMEWPWAERHSASCALLAIDLDHFKEVNDTHGHPAGDSVLRQVVDTMFDAIREEDLLARVGGEEFVVLCRSTSRAAARVLAERIRERVAADRCDWRGRSIAMTVSIGVAASEEEGIRSPDDLRKRADEQLYAAKHAGRNCVHPAPGE